MQILNAICDCSMHFNDSINSDITFWNTMSVDLEKSANQPYVSNLKIIGVIKDFFSNSNILIQFS